jgi:hypothetical protein
MEVGFEILTTVNNEEYYPWGRGALCSDKSSRAFQRNILHPYSVLKSKSSEKQVSSRERYILET